MDMKEFVVMNRERFEEYENARKTRGLPHDFTPYDAIKKVADAICVEVEPVDYSGINYVIRFNGAEVRLGFLNRSDLPNEVYAAMRIIDGIKCCLNGLNVS